MSFHDEVTKNHGSTSKKDSNIKNIEIFKKAIKKLNYEESIAELETILQNLQDENISFSPLTTSKHTPVVLQSL